MKTKNDMIWDLIWKNPIAIYQKRKHEKSARARFDYEKNGDMSVISANCIGGEIYHILGLKFTSPLINTSMDRNDFSKLAANLKDYFASELIVQEKNNNGEWVGKLTSSITGETVSIAFVHERDREQILKQWNSRVKRVNYSNLYLINDNIGLSEESMELMSRVICTNYIIFTSCQPKNSHCHCLKEYKGQKFVGTYQGKRIDGLFKFQKMWDFVAWFNGSK